MKKKKGEVRIDADTIYARIKPIGVVPYEPQPPLNQDQQDAMFSRRFISQTYGGGEQGVITPIRKEKLLEHGLNDWKYLSLEMNPYAPQRIGAPGLSFHVGIDGMGGFTDDDSEPLDRLFCRIGANEWQYMGQYKSGTAQPLSLEEWRRLHWKVGGDFFWMVCVLTLDIDPG